MDSSLREYIKQSRFSNPGPHTHLLDIVPSSVADICTMVQGLLLNIFTAHFYKVSVPQDARKNTDMENACEILSAIIGIDDHSLTLPRDPNRRLPVICRQFALLTCAILRHKGIPARIRSGFADYLAPNMRVGHSICEYMCSIRNAWIRIDPQIDPIQRECLGIDFDPLDIPAGSYLSGAEAWRAFRMGTLPVVGFEGGIANLRNILCLDLLELNALETHASLPAMIGRPEQAPSKEDMPILDDLSRKIVDGQSSFDAMRSLYESNNRLQAMNGIISSSDGW